jgi:predicted ATPase/DNA-binding CsgD family transcriptional regulator
MVPTLLSEPTLPDYATRFVGRARELDSLRQLLASGFHAGSSPRRRSVTLIGIGGAGKTRLAVETARTFISDADPTGAAHLRVRWVDCAPATDGTGLARAVASALGLALPAAASGLVELIDAALGGGPVLLVLDNTEQVAEASRRLLRRLLRGHPSLVVLVTSRVPLHARGEQVFAVPPLTTDGESATASERPTSEAAQLFLDRAEMVMPGYRMLGDSPPAIDALCRRLDGSPLAIELAASWSTALSAADLLGEIEHDLDILSATTPTLPLRHRSLRAVLDSSWRRLGEDERQLLARLSVFPGSFSRRVALTVTDGSLTSLRALTEKCLVQRLPDAGVGTRYHVHQVVRDHARHQLAAAGELDATHRRLFDVMLELVSEGSPAGRAEPDDSPHGDVRGEQANLITALRWAIDQRDADRALRLAAGLTALWVYASPVTAYTSAVEAALALPWDAGCRRTAVARAAALGVAAYGAVFSGDLEMAGRRFAEAADAHAGLGDERRVAWCLQGWSYALTLAGAFGRAEPLEQRALKIYGRLGDERGLAWALHDLGEIAFARGDVGRAAPLLDAGRAAFEAAGIPYGSYRSRSLLGDVHRVQGRWAEAAAWYGRALEAQQRGHFSVGGAEILEGLAQVATALHQPVRAARLFGAGHAWRRTWGLARFPLYEAEHSRALALAQEQLTPERWLESYTAGWQLDPDEAVEVARQAATALTEVVPPPGRAHLTARQREVVRLLAQGWSNAAIADHLVLSPRTVDAHLRTVYARLGVASRTGAVHEAARLRLI